MVWAPPVPARPPQETIFGLRHRPAERLNRLGYINPDYTGHCAYPCRAALKYQLAASAESCGTPNPLVHPPISN